MARWVHCTWMELADSNATFSIGSVQELPDRFVPFRHCPWLIVDTDANVIAVMSFIVVTMTLPAVSLDWAFMGRGSRSAK